MPKFKDYKQGRQPCLLPINLDEVIPVRHLVRQIDAVVERIDIRKLQTPFSSKGASSYHPQMMLKVILYAYATKNYSCRNIARMLRQDITYMWLSGNQRPDFNTVNRFRSEYLKEVIEEVFKEVLMFLAEHDFIKFETYFVDGTKLEADANKFSHVWKKNTERYKAAVQERVAKLMDEIEQVNQQEDELFAGKDLPELGEASQISSEQVGEIAQNISDKLDQKQGQAKKSTLKKFSGKVKKLLAEKENLEKYEEQEKILDQRNSYSKTDHDATMMRMKGTDELRPGYNAQASSENQFVLATSVGQNAADQSSFAGHLDGITKMGENFLPVTYVGDGAYGTEENSEILERAKIFNHLKYPSFYQEQSTKHKEDPFHKDNMAYDLATDSYTCPNNVRLVYRETIERCTTTGYKQTVKVYKSEGCEGCPMKQQCTKAEGDRTIQINPNLERHKEIIKENLLSEIGEELRKRRGWEIETFFGDLKHNQQYKRIRLRGLEKANLELKYLAITYNIRKASILLNKMAA